MQAFFESSNEDEEDKAVFLNYDYEADVEFIPKLQKGLIISSCLSLVETLLREVCKEIELEFSLNGKGSYIQQFSQYIKTNTTIVIDKEFLKSFEAFGHLRNSFLHSLGYEIPQSSQQHLNSLTGGFSDIEAGVSGIHVDLCLKTLNDFGAFFQGVYWEDFELRDT